MPLDEELDRLASTYRTDASELVCPDAAEEAAQKAGDIQRQADELRERQARS